MLSEFLDVVSLVKLGCVSKKWKNIVRNSSAWKKLYEDKFGDWEYNGPGAPFPTTDWLLKYKYASG